MKVSAISYSPAFSAKKNSLKAGTTAAVILLSVPVYAQDNPQINLPDCFVYGVSKTENKSPKKIFAEIDSLSKPDNQITSEEVILATRKLWKNTHNNKEKMPIVEEYYAEDTFDRLARNYNKENSDPNTLDFDEYMTIMNDYKKYTENKNENK